MATCNATALSKTLTAFSSANLGDPKISKSSVQISSSFSSSSSSSSPRFPSLTSGSVSFLGRAPPRGSGSVLRAVVDSNYSSRRGSSNEERETILLPGCDFNHWLIVMEFPKDPAPTREQMIETYLNTLATVLGSMEEAKKNMYAFSTTTYTGFQCTVDEETSEKFKGLPGVLWVLPDSYIDVKNKDYGGDKYVNGEIIPCKYPTYQPNKRGQRNNSKYESRRYERRRESPPPRKQTRVEAPQSDTST